MYLHQPDSNMLIDGFTIRDGNADVEGSISFSCLICGGGLHIDGYYSELIQISATVFLHTITLTPSALGCW